MTKITAPPIPAAVSVFFDTPKKGQIPRNWLNTTLFTMAEPIAINNNVCICHIPPIHFFPLHLQLSSLFRCRLQTCCIRHSLH